MTVLSWYKNIVKGTHLRLGIDMAYQIGEGVRSWCCLPGKTLWGFYPEPPRDPMPGSVLTLGMAHVVSML